MTQADFQISGVSATAQNSNFSDGTAKITDGEGIDDSDKGTNNVVIDSTLAETNDLAVGDTFTITSTEDEDTTYEMTIKGIYESSETSGSMGMKFNFMNPSNTLYTSYTFANELNGTSDDNTIDSAIYTLSDPDKMDEFLKEAEKLIDTDTFSLQSNDSMYQSMLEPLNNVASFSKNVVLLVAVAGIIILTLIIMITIRERRHELGVLLSLGESRSKIILQLFTEVAICMILALELLRLAETSSRMPWDSSYLTNRQKPRHKTSKLLAVDKCQVTDKNKAVNAMVNKEPRIIHLLFLIKSANWKSMSNLHNWDY